jgi:hypothetical protein
LKLAAKSAILYLNNAWFKYVDDKFYVIIKFLLFGSNAMVDAELVQESQEWLFKWSLLYFNGMGIEFKK